MHASAVLRFGFLSLLMSTAAVAQAPAAPPVTPQGQTEIVTLPDVKPERSGAKVPTARNLVDSWFGGVILPDATHYDRERFEILGLRFGKNRPDTAFMHLRRLPLAGSAADHAAKLCPGRTAPLEAQLFFQWSPAINSWVMHASRGSDLFKPCENEPLWSADEIEKIIDPPPWPQPPKISKKDVTTPKAGSPERKAILDALRPSFEALLKAPVEFKVTEMKVAAGFAWVSVHPQRPGGREFPAKDWNATVGACEYDQKEASAQVWMHRGAAGWEIAWGGTNTLCAGDSIGGHGYVVGAPPQLSDIDSYGDEPMLFPVDDPQYFKLWWLQKK